MSESQRRLQHQTAPYGSRTVAPDGAVVAQSRVGHRGVSPPRFGLEERAPVRVTIEGETGGAIAFVLLTLAGLRWAR